MISSVIQSAKNRKSAMLLLTFANQAILFNVDFIQNQSATIPSEFQTRPVPDLPFLFITSVKK